MFMLGLYSSHVFYGLFIYLAVIVVSTEIQSENFELQKFQESAIIFEQSLRRDT